jgi:pimeloyl-ACP methyl ester carboxylesterase
MREKSPTTFTATTASIRVRDTSGTTARTLLATRALVAACAVLAGCASSVHAFATSRADDATSPKDAPSLEAAPGTAGPQGIDASAAFATHAWCVSGVTAGARWPLRVDLVEGAVARGSGVLNWVEAASGDAPSDAPSDLQDGSAGPPALGGEAPKWTRVDTPGGVIPGDAIRGGYAVVTIERAKDTVALLRARGHGMVYVNGEPRAGDPYAHGFLELPVRLRAGANTLVFAGGRGDVAYTLTDTPPGIEVTLEDATLPDLVPNAAESVPLGVAVRNSTDAATAMADAPGALMARARVDQGAWTTTTLGAVESMTMRKVAVFVDASGVVLAEGAASAEVALEIEVLAPGASEPVARARGTLRVVRPEATRAITRVSEIDGSVQYYSLVPATSASDAPSGIVLSLHGASVEARSQAASYAPKAGLHIVAPTNRRPFGFDWEDWGRRDALETLAHASRTLATDPLNVHVTGHSMGGHGTWQLASLFPDRFASAAPSAGWESFASYGGWMPPVADAESTDHAAVRALFRRAAGTSQTALLAENLRDKPIFILHGDADETVPVEQARTMRRLLEGVAPVEYHEQPGAGHWWDDDQVPGAGPGAACVDWPGFFAMFERARLADRASVASVAFTTLDPAVSPRSHWLVIEQQVTPGEPSTIDASLDGETLTVTTRNVRRFRVDMDEPPRVAIIDGHEVAGTGFVREESAGGAVWRAGFASPSDRAMTRSGPFKRAFDRRALLVYGTLGTPQENAWARAKAIYDAETFAYRGNGSFEVVSDRAYLAAIDRARAAGREWVVSRTRVVDAEGTSDADTIDARNVVVYGTRESNAAWTTVLPASPIEVTRGAVRLMPPADDAVALEGDDLVAVFVAPSPLHPDALIGAVAPTGPGGMLTANRLAFFLSGAGFPDWLVLDGSMLSDRRLRGLAGVRGGGFFDHQWRLGGDRVIVGPTPAVEGVPKP